jgi:hypothetical protein
MKTTDLHKWWYVEDLREHSWSLYQDEVKWVVDGEECSAEVKQSTTDQGLYFINADNGCGDNLTYIFDTEKQVLEGELDG